MAKKVKKTKKKGVSAKKSGNVFTKILVVILVLILAFFIVSRFLTPSKPDVNANGAWMNGNDESLIIKDNRYAIYLSGIERDHPIVGECKVKGDVITFVNKKDPCEGAKGLYEVSFNGNDIIFKCKDDGCSKRQAILLNDWQWLDADMDDITIDE